jgi:hypothetical protein
MLKRFFKGGKNRSKQMLKVILHIAILAGVLIAANRYLRGEEVVHALSAFNFAYLPGMLFLATVFIILKSWRFVLWMRLVTDIPSGIIFRGHVAGTAATLVPGGMTARAGLMKQAGVPLSKSSAPVAFNSIFDQIAFIAGVFLAAFWVEEARQPTMILAGILVVLGLIFWVPTSRGYISQATKWAAERLNLLEQWRQFIESVKDVLTTHAGSDAHTLAEIGSAWVEIPLRTIQGPKDLMDALRGGKPVGDWTHPVVAYVYKVWDRTMRKMKMRR